MEAIVGIIVGSFALWVGYRRMAYVGAMFKRREELARMEKVLRDARDHASGPSPWRVVGDADRDLVALLAAAATDERGLEALGFRRLGDVVAGYPDRAPTMIMRVFVKDAAFAGLIVSRIPPTLVSRTPSARLRISLSSYGPSEQFTTARGSDGRSLAMPPWLHLKHLDAKASTGDVVAAHAADLPADLRTLKTLDEVLENIATQRARVQQWRDAQPPDELLDADLRGMLGPHYAKAGAYWARRLRGKLPDATLRRG